MKILHYIPSIDESSGGVGAYMQLLSRDLGSLCELHVLTHKGTNERVLENCNVHYIPYKWLPWDSCKGEFLELLNDIRPDVFHTNCCWLPLSAMTAMWAKSQGYKVVYTPHGMLEPYSISRFYWRKKFPAIILYQRKGVALCDVVHATAESEKENLLKLGWNKRVAVIPNCVKIDEIPFKYGNSEYNDDLFHRHKTVLFLSRVHPKKGLDILIEAVARLKNRFAGYKFVIAGDGEPSYIDDLKDFANKKGVGDFFDFIGPVYGAEKWELYDKADLFVLPTHSENFGIVVAEALASGVPVITTKGTPWKELEVNKCGWWTEISVEGIVKALADFLNATDVELQQMGKNGRALIEHSFGSQAVARQFVSLYNQVIH